MDKKRTDQLSNKFEMDDLLNDTDEHILTIEEGSEITTMLHRDLLQQ